MIHAKQAIPVYGENLLASLEPRLFEKAAVLCAPEAWELAKDSFPLPPLAVMVPRSMEQKLLEAQLATLPDVDTVFGIGGGSACDGAKMAAYLTGAKLVLVPSIISVDAAFTSAVGVRVDRRVRYVGAVVPAKLLIDFALISRAPKALNRAGVGDVLSIFTALHDWRLARDTVNEAYDPAIASESQRLLARLMERPGDIRDCNNQGLRRIADLYVAEVALCDRHGDSRPEEGSEHYFAYCLEHLTGRSYIHGDLVCLAVVLTALHQGQDVSAAVAFLDETLVRFRPTQVGVSREELVETLAALPAFLAQETQLPYGIYHHRPLDRPAALDLVERLEAVLAGA